MEPVEATQPSDRQHPPWSGDCSDEVFAIMCREIEALVEFWVNSEARVAELETLARLPDYPTILQSLFGWDKHPLFSSLQEDGLLPRSEDEDLSGLPTLLCTVLYKVQQSVSACTESLERGLRRVTGTLVRVQPEALALDFGKTS